MRKSFISLFLVMSLLICNVSIAFASETGMSNFTKNKAYDGRFTDVRTTDWFYTHVKEAYEYGFVSGNSETTFNPLGNITLAETLVIACQIHSKYYGNSIGLVPNGPWYTSYVKYAVDNSIIRETTYDDYTVPATRAEFVSIMAKTLPDVEFEPVRTVTSVPDVPTALPFSKEVYKFYNAGIINGSDALGTFNPYSNIRRCEVAVIALNIVTPERRKPTVSEDIAVEQKPISSITYTYNRLSRSSYIMSGIGDSVQLSVITTPQIDNPDVKWTSSDNSIATVTQKGLVVGLQPGVATISATAPTGQKFDCKIVVDTIEVCDTLISYCIRNGGFGNGVYTYIFENLGTEAYYAVQYDVNDDKLVFSLYSPYGYSLAIDIGSGIEKPCAGMASYEPTFTGGKFIIIPQLFKKDCYFEVFDYSGFGITKQDFTKTTYESVYVLISLADSFLNTLGYSIADLGFVNFK